MKIILLGASGIIGKATKNELKKRHQVISVCRNNCDISVDMTSNESIENMYKEIGSFDALISTAGETHFGAFSEMKEADFYKGIKSKMMGQINLVMIGKEYINKNGSFTLTTGILADDPIKGSIGSSVVNGAVNAFVQAASLELQKNIRINVVSPGMVADATEKYELLFPGFNPVPMHKVINGYLRSVEGHINGKVLRIFEL